MNVGPVILCAMAAASGAILVPLSIYMYLRSPRVRRNWKNKLSDSTQIENLLPLAETHIDYFLRHKLTTAMPMVAMFIGDKTIAQFKAIFMEELKELLPEFTAAYLDQLLSRDRLTKMIWNQLAIKLMSAGACLGLAIGLVQCIILVLWK
jgi:hypothetical protein